METIELCFPGGRFHATPWGRHVNEGVPEWPPSPFRLLRALYDAWRRKHPELPQERLEALLMALSREVPSFELPPAVAAHVRVYLRQDSEVESDKKLVFDPFVSLMPEVPTRIIWPGTTLSDVQRADLDLLLASLGFFGRSESLVQARRGSGPAPSPNAVPVAGGNGQRDLLRVACVASPDAALPPLVLPGKGKKKSAELKLEWLEALGWGSREVLQHRMTEPPALKWVDFAMPPHALRAPPARRREQNRPVRSLLFGLDGKVLPLVTETVAFAEQFRRRAMGGYKRIVGGDEPRIAPVLSGKGDDDGPARDAHAHASFLPLDLDCDGRLDHLLVRAGSDLDADVMRALTNVKVVALSRGRPEVRVVRLRAGKAGEGLAGQSGTVFRSATPFVPTRHYKVGPWALRGGYDGWLFAELARALLQHFGAGGPMLVRAKMLPEHVLKGRGPLRWLKFKRNRQSDAPRTGLGFEIEVDRSIEGPFSLGYGSHFGLGLFTAVQR